MTGTVRSSDSNTRVTEAVNDSCLCAPSAAASHFHGTGESPRDAQGLFDVTPLFEEAPPPVTRINPATLPILFTFVSESLAFATSSQPHHFALSAPGIRHKPVVHRTENFDFQGLQGFKVRADRGNVYIVDTVGDSKQVVVSINTESNAVLSFSTTRDRKISEPRNAVVTREGLAFSWDYFEDDLRQSRVQMLSHVDPKTKRVLWIKELAKGQPDTTVDFLGCLPGGDLIAIYGLARTLGGEDVYTRIARFDATTGDKVFDKPCPWPSVEYGQYLSAQRTGKFQFHFYDEKSSTAIIGLFVYGFPQCVQFFEVNFEDGELKEVGDRVTTAFSVVAQSKVTDNRVLLQDGLTTAMLNRDAEGNVSLRPFNQHPSPKYPIMVSADGIHAVQAFEKNLCFFSVGDDGFNRPKIVDLPAGFEIDTVGRSHADNAALTVDNVYYCTTVNMKTESPVQCRLVAYDATTGEKLWELDEPFEKTPTLSINPQGTITWLDNTKALILKDS